MSLDFRCLMKPLYQSAVNARASEVQHRSFKVANFITASFREHYVNSSTFKLENERGVKTG